MEPPRSDHDVPPPFPPSMPPPPPFVPAYAIPDQRQPSDFGNQAAKASLVAPLIGFAINCLGRANTSQPDRTLSLVFGGISGLLIIAGFTFAIIAIIKASSGRNRGYLGTAILGLVFNTLLIALIGGVAFFATRTAARRSAAARTQLTAAQAQAAGRDAFVKSDGWYGIARLPNATIVFSEISQDSALARDMRGEFSTPVSLDSIAIDNSAGTQPLIVDPDSLTFSLANGSKIKALRSRSVLSSARSDTAHWLAKYGSPWTVAPGTKMNDGIAMMPPGAILHSAIEATIDVNGRPTRITGRFVTSEEKVKLFSQQEQKGQ